jgi:hypothetical protein
MPRLNELDLSFSALQRAKDAVDAVAGIAIDAPHTPLVKSFDKKIANGLRHGVCPHRKGLIEGAGRKPPARLPRSTLRRWRGSEARTASPVTTQEAVVQ